MPDLLGIGPEFVDVRDREGIERWVHNGVLTGL